MECFKHYIVDGQPMSMKQMREIVEKVLEHGPVAYHLPVSEIVNILNRDNRKVKVIV